MITFQASIRTRWVFTHIALPYLIHINRSLQHFNFQPPREYIHLDGRNTPQNHTQGNESTMTDLQPSLVVPESSRSSEESFRSVASQSNSAPLSSSKAPSSSNTFASSAVFQHAGLDVYDIDQYLSENANLRATPSRGKAASKGSDQSANGTTEPIALGTETSYFTGALNKKCQSKGFLPVFDIEGETDFGGVLKLRDVNITSDRRYPTKKKAKEALAEKGLETVNGMEATRKEPGTPQEPRKNWVGMLHGKSMSQ